MSLVGPRPLPQRDFDQLEEWHKKRYLVLPGITGLWQVSGPLGAGLRRPRAARLPLPRALVGRARPHDPAQDHARRAAAPRRVLGARRRRPCCSRSAAPGDAAHARRASRSRGGAAARRGRRPSGARTTRMARRFRAAGPGRARAAVRDAARALAQRDRRRCDGPRDCLRVVMAHTDSMPGGSRGGGQRVGPRAAGGAGAAPAARAATCGSWPRAPRSGSTRAPPTTWARWRWRGSCRAARLRYALSLDEVGTSARFRLRSPVAAPRRRVERELLRSNVGWQRDSGTGNSDHREFELAGMRGVKLGVVDNPCRHLACDTPDRLRKGAFRAALRAVGGRWPASARAAARVARRPGSRSCARGGCAPGAT